MVGGGALSGGIGSSIAGGNFWEGFGIAATVGLLNHAAHNGLFGGSDPTTKFEHWEYTGEIEWGSVIEGGFNIGLGIAMVHSCTLGIMTGKLALPGAGLIMYGSTSIGFGMAQTMKGFMGYKAKTPMNFPGAIDYGLGGSGVAGTTLDGVINFSYSSSNFERVLYGVNTIRNISNLRVVNPPQNIHIQNFQFSVQDNTRVYIQHIHR